jgi:GDSL-like Lipase/Acylhydrolase family
MSAMNGLTLSRSRGRLLGVALVAVFAMAGLFASSASAELPPVTHTDVGLGDSLAFGYSQQLFNEHLLQGEPPKDFEHGYVNFYFNKMHPKENGIRLVNLGCPGETSDGLIGNGPLGAALESGPIVGPGGQKPHGEAPCAYHYVNGLPLHHEYGGTKSQLESFVETYEESALTGKPVNTITLNIGANDELHGLKACEKQGETEAIEKFLKGEITAAEIKPVAEAIAKGCVLASAPKLFEHILVNISAILALIRTPTVGGGLGYTGLIVVQGGYNPFGYVFTNAEEALPGTNLLALKLNQAEAAAVAPFGACYADPQPVFNPTVVFGTKQFKPGAEGLEKQRLDELTNMVNMTVTTIAGTELHYGEKEVEVLPGVKTSADGPDIHPTPKGYATLATVMFKACGL